ncbi:MULTISPECIES: outer membrane beta-barrel protein [Vibrio]|uniref:outer membrane beta-barrel protein n=1 Tax=Vibrio TaxID=662 RepID=UPI00068C484C|nr:outer membrane beta-barrel protein [Vibrio pacinii]
MLRKTVVAVALLTACSIANANPYVGGSIGQAKFDHANASLNSAIMSGSEALEMQDDSSLAGKIYAGYQFNQYFALEGAIGGYDALDGDIVTVGDMKFVAFQPKAILPLTDRFSLYAKAGIAYFNAEFKVSNSVVGASGYTTMSDTTMTGIYGIGAEFALTDNLHLEATWDYMNPELEVVKLASATATIDADINVFSLGLSYHF